MAQRRRREFGEIQERKTKTGWRYYPRFSLPGSRDRYTPGVAFTSRDAASRWLTTERELWERHVANGTETEWLPPKTRREGAQAQRATDALTVKELCEMWLTDGHLKKSTESSSRGKLQYRVYNHALAEVTLGEITPETVEAWWSDIKRTYPDTGNSNGMAYRKLSTVFRWAVEEKHLLESSPVNIKGAGDVPRSEKRLTPVIAVPEAWAMINGVRDRYRAPVAILLFGGLRLGELLALKRSDLLGLEDEGLVTIRVRRNAQRIQEPVIDEETGARVVNTATGQPKTRSKMLIINSPKTPAGNRDVALPQTVSDMLRDHAERNMRGGADALVCPDKDGNVMMDTAFRSGFNKGRDAAGRTDVSPHDCRRFYGTMLITNGVPWEDARRLMGHETVEQLAEYQRSASGYEATAAAVLERLTAE